MSNEGDDRNLPTSGASPPVPAEEDDATATNDAGSEAAASASSAAARPPETLGEERGASKDGLVADSTSWSSVPASAPDKETSISQTSSPEDCAEKGRASSDGSGSGLVTAAQYNNIQAPAALTATCTVGLGSSPSTKSQAAVSDREGPEWERTASVPVGSGGNAGNGTVSEPPPPPAVSPPAAVLDTDGALAAAAAEEDERGEGNGHDSRTSAAADDTVASGFTPQPSSTAAPSRSGNSRSTIDSRPGAYHVQPLGLTTLRRASNREPPAVHAEASAGDVVQGADADVDAVHVVPTAYTVDDDPIQSIMVPSGMERPLDTSRHDEKVWPLGRRKRGLVISLSALTLATAVTLGVLGGTGRLGNNNDGGAASAADTVAGGATGCFGPGNEPPAFCSSPNSSRYNCWEELTCDLVGDLGWEEFGGSVSTSRDGKRIAISAEESDVGGFDSGSVYIYDVVDSDPRGGGNGKDGAKAVLVQVGEDIVGDPGDQIFGVLSGDGSHLAIGATWYTSVDNNLSSAGQVRIYRLDAETSSWVMVGDPIDGEFPEERAGRGLDLSFDGGVVGIGAPSNGMGRARIFKYSDDEGIWIKLGKDIIGAGVDSQFGWDISCSEDCLTVAIGASSYSDSIVGFRSGQIGVYRYESESIGWTQVGSISGEAAGDRFGRQTAISADGLVVAGSSWKHNGAGQGSETGQVRVFRYDSNSTWEQVGQSIVGDGPGDRLLAVALSANGRRVATGSGTKAEGYARIYENVNDQWHALGGKIGGQGSCRGSGTDISLSASTAVSLSGSGMRMVYGCPLDDGGVVRVFELPWMQVASMEGQSLGDEFGYGLSVALSGARHVMSAERDGSYGEEAGSVRVFDVFQHTLTQIGQVIHGSPGDRIRGLLSRDGQRLIVGARYYDGINGTVSQAGQVRVFEFDDKASDWTLLGDPIYGDAVKDRAGNTFAISRDGNIIGVGLPFHGGPGAVRVYEYTNGNWKQLGSDLYGETTSERFGWHMAMSDNGSIIAVGSRWNNNGNLTKAGSLSVFRYGGAEKDWAQLGETIYGTGEGDIFGARVMLSSDGMIAAGGAYLNSDSGYESGHVRVFSYDEERNMWQQMGSTITGDNAGDKLAVPALSADGKRIVASAPGAHNSTGFARVYDYLDDEWKQVGGTIEGRQTGNEFGWDNAMSEDGLHLSVGSPARATGGSRAGAVRLFDLPPR